MTREEAIKILEESRRQNQIMLESPTTFFRIAEVEEGIKNAERRIKALNMAISTLRAQQKPNAPLTLDELWEMNGEPVWVTHKDGSGGRWGVVETSPWGIGATVCNRVTYWFGDCAGSIAYRHKLEDGET